MTSLGRIMAAAAALTLLAGPAVAQQLNSGATGRHGQVSLRAGFEPDPHHATVTAGGVYDASQVSTDCTGYIDTRATFTLRYRAGELPLYIASESDADTTLVVRAPDGSWHCDDDSAGNLNPVVSWETPRSGRYQIWVGRYGVQNETAAANLHISEVGGPENSGTAAGAPDFSLDPAYGVIELAAGFMPDPHRVEIAAGGGYDASGIPGCVGWIASAPDYRVNWTAGGQLPLTFHVTADTDTTLVINDAEGNWVCNDDAQGLNPAISFENAPSGQYDVWVGTYMQGDLQPSVLNVTEVYTPDGNYEE
ncbi:peptidase [Terricaulis sp.]|uniref:peptidase n=1 Tax=Terricaulis sp. TaxID=2768686 RepID=UPI002AC3D009|nr:peptidase [Terricaulis sp.]MDZ4690408.1 peptidase [Terricaulis sp.]